MLPIVMFSMLSPCPEDGPLYNGRVIDRLLSRASVKSLGEPGPDDAQLRVIFEAAVRAPDHGKLRPWRFYVVRGDARGRLSAMFVARREAARTGCVRSAD